MAHLELTLRDIVGWAANAAAISGASLLALALCAERVRRRDSGSALVRVTDRVMPATMHRVAVGILSLLATVASVATPSVASADPSLRGWLESPSEPTTVMKPATESERARPPADDAAGPANRDGRVPRTRAEPQPPDGPSALPSPAPAPGPPTPSPAPVIHPHTSAAPPLSAPGPIKNPATRSRTPVAPVDPTPTMAADAPHTVDSSVEHVVVAGDCLWDIATRLIGPGASNAAIDRGWRAIYAANRIAIGDDPGLIQPGLVLTVPVLDPTP